MNVKKKAFLILKLAIIAALLLSVALIAPTSAIADNENLYFFKFEQSLRTDYGNEPDKVIYNDDGSLTMRCINVAQQKQVYFKVNSDLTAAAIDRAKSSGTNKLYCSVDLKSCVDEFENEQPAEIKIWIDLTWGSDVIVQQWQESGTKVTYELNVANVNSGRVKGFYVCAMNYQLSNGIAPIVTFSAVTTNPPIVETGSEIQSEFDYNENSNGTLTIKGYSGKDINVIVPEQIDSKIVTKIGEDAFSYNTDIESVVIPDSVTTVMSSAFQACTFLESVTMSKGIKYIHEYAFTNCKRIKTIDFGSKLISIGRSAFLNCAKLTQIVLPETVTSVASFAFDGCAALKTAKLSENITKLSNSIFNNCSSLEQIEIPSKVSSIGVFAFNGCTALKSAKSYRGSCAREYFLTFGYKYDDINNGDANSDGNVNAKDILLLRQKLSGFKVTLNEEASDISHDSKINGKDSFSLRRIIAQIDVQPKIDAVDPDASAVDKLKASYKLSWNDEFNADVLDTKYWGYEGSNTHRNGELQSYCDTPEEGNVYLQDGKMVIEARREERNGYSYSSGSVNTAGKKHFKYGILEMCAKLPKGKGVWPAFWAMGLNPITGYVNWPATGELDILEMIGGGANDSTAYATAHWQDSAGQHKSLGSSTVLDNSVFNDAYHKFGAIWTDTDIYWYMDDIIFFTYDTTPAERSEYNECEFYIILNLAIGGSWAGAVSDSTEFPARYYVDYVRYYQNA